MNAPRNCLACTRCIFYPGSPHYSELTPGEPLDSRCAEGVWDADLAYDKAALLRDFDTALTCDKWDPEPGHENDEGATK